MLTTRSGGCAGCAPPPRHRLGLRCWNCSACRWRCAASPAITSTSIASDRRRHAGCCGRRRRRWQICRRRGVPARAVCHSYRRQSRWSRALDRRHAAVGLPRADLPRGLHLREPRRVRHPRHRRSRLRCKAGGVRWVAQRLAVQRRARQVRRRRPPFRQREPWLRRSGPGRGLSVRRAARSLAVRRRARRPRRPGSRLHRKASGIHRALAARRQASLAPALASARGCRRQPTVPCRHRQRLTRHERLRSSGRPRRRPQSCRRLPGPSRHRHRASRPRPRSVRLRRRRGPRHQRGRLPSPGRCRRVPRQSRKPARLASHLRSSAASASAVEIEPRRSAPARSSHVMNYPIAWRDAARPARPSAGRIDPQAGCRRTPAPRRSSPRRRIWRSCRTG
jgi:hypothetical protein